MNIVEWGLYHLSGQASEDARWKERVRRDWEGRDDRALREREVEALEAIAASARDKGVAT